MFMKYLLFTLTILLAIPSLADKKKNKSGSKVKSNASATNSDGTEKSTSPDAIANNSSKGKLPATQVGAPLIQFLVHEWNGQEFNNDMLGKGSLIVMLYNPGCDHCLEMCKSLLANRDKMKNTEWLLISGVDTKPAVNEFMTNAGINESDPNIHVTLAERDVTDLIFEAKGIPQLMIYDKNKILQKVYFSEADMNEVVSLLNK